MIQHYVIKFVGDLRQVNGFLPVLQFSSTKKTDCHNMTEILLKAVLNTINQTIYWNLDLPMNLVPMWRLSMKCFPQELQFSQCLKVAVKIPRIPMNLQKNDHMLMIQICIVTIFKAFVQFLQSWKYRLLLLLRLLSYCILLFYISVLFVHTANSYIILRIIFIIYFILYFSILFHLELWVESSRL